MKLFIQNKKYFMNLKQTNIILVFRGVKLLIFPVLGMLLLYWSMNLWGIDFSFDSSIYLLTAENFIRGEGLNIAVSSGRVLPQMHYPPLYSMLLALLISAGIDNLSAPLYMNIFLFGLNILIFSLIIYESTSSLKMSLLMSFLLFSSNIFIYIHTIAMSEALFIALSFLSFYFLLKHIKYGDYTTLIISSVLMGAAFLTRYAGAAFVAAGVVTIIIYNLQKPVNALKKATIMVILGILPAIIWTLGHFSLLIKYIALGGRSFKWHPVSVQILISLADVVSKLFLPAKTPFQIRTIFLLIVSTIVFYMLYKYRKVMFCVLKKNLKNPDTNNAVFIITILYLIMYTLLIVFSIFLVDAFISLNSRILSPLFATLLILSVHGVHRFVTQVKGQTIINLLLIAIISGGVLLSSVRSIYYLLILHNEGMGYVSMNSRKSEIIKYLKHHSEKSVIFANDPAPVFLLTGKRADFLPSSVFPFTQTPNPNLESDIEFMKEQLKNRNGIVICFKDGVHKYMMGYCIKEDYLIKKINLTRILHCKNGNIYVLKKSGSRHTQ